MMIQCNQVTPIGLARELRLRRNRPTQCKRGQALVPIVFVLMILTVVAVAFATAAGHEIRSAGNFASDTQRYYAARGAVYYAVSSLAQSSNNGATYGVITPTPDADANGWRQIGDAWVKVDAVDTAGMLNINEVDATTLQTWPLFQQNPDLAAAIIDWRSPEDQSSPNGAKSSYYQSLPQPYSAKDTPFDTLEELLLVKGMTPTILYGSISGSAVSPADIAASVNNGNAGGIAATRQAAGGNGTNGGGTGGANGGGAGSQSGGSASGTGSTDPNQFASLFADSRIPMSELLTTIVSERNVAVDGTARVNINTATEQDLVNKLQLPENLAANLVTFRNAGNNNGGNNNGGGTPGGGTQGGGTGNQGGGNGPNGLGLGGKPGLSGGGGSLGRPGGTGPGNAGPGGLGSRQAVGLGNNQGLGLGNQGGAAGSGSGTGGSGAGSGNAGGSGAGGSGSGTGSGSSSPVFKSIADLLEVGGFTRTIMAQIADKIAVDDNAARDDVVNINTAPQEVLAMVPGMDTTILNAIMTYRQSGQAFQSLNDFFALQQLGRQQFQQVIAHLCTKSSIYRMHVRVRTAGQQNLYAAIVLVELTPNGPRILQWRETPRTPGWSTWMPTPSLPAPTAPTTQNGSS